MKPVLCVLHTEMCSLMMVRSCAVRATIECPRVEAVPDRGPDHSTDGRLMMRWSALQRTQGFTFAHVSWQDETSLLKARMMIVRGLSLRTEMLLRGVNAGTYHQSFSVEQRRTVKSNLPNTHQKTFPKPQINSRHNIYRSILTFLAGASSTSASG